MDQSVDGSAVHQQYHGGQAHHTGTSSTWLPKATSIGAYLMLTHWTCTLSCAGL